MNRTRSTWPRRNATPCFYARDHGEPAMGIQITYCAMETEEIRRFRQDFSAQELEEWFKGLVHEYLKWASYLYHHISAGETSPCGIWLFPIHTGKARRGSAGWYTGPSTKSRI